MQDLLLESKVGPPQIGRATFADIWSSASVEFRTYRGLASRVGRIGAYRSQDEWRRALHRVFISHSSRDDKFVRELRAELADASIEAWIDSRELRGGDSLWGEIERAIRTVDSVVVIVSKDSLQSEAVARELQFALSVQKTRGQQNYRVIPLSLDGTKLGAFRALFEDEPLYIAATSEAGGVEAVLHPLLVALGVRAPSDRPPDQQLLLGDLEDLVLELFDLRAQTQNGASRATARARLLYRPASHLAREVASASFWRFVAPLDVIETGELSWYLEQYPAWPSGVRAIEYRARQVRENLVAWGRRLHSEAMPADVTSNVLLAWEQASDVAGRRFTVCVDSAVEFGASEDQIVETRRVASELLGIPWEILHDGQAYLFQGCRPIRVRRGLSNAKSIQTLKRSLPVRILVVAPRPEDETCAYIDHRLSASPLVDAMESMPGLVQVKILKSPTLGDFSEEMRRAQLEGAPYHVVHFDGHGSYDSESGLAGLCFESPQDSRRPDMRRSEVVLGAELGSVLRDHRISLVFLDACHSARAEKAPASLAADLLRIGVASVIAMSHAVLVETSRRFAIAFYGSLVEGARVGDAMLAGQRALKDDSYRGRVVGAEALSIEDWFVPVLFQERSDPPLFEKPPNSQTVEDARSRLAVRLGEIPRSPASGFVGRSRDLLALQRMFSAERFAVVVGEGGQGKTALAAEFGRWMVRSQQFRRCAFVVIEAESTATSVLDVLGRQIVGKNYSAVVHDTLESALEPIERSLREQNTLLILDNLESILQPPWARDVSIVSEAARYELDQILLICSRLLLCGDTKLLFTSRERPPAPFEADSNMWVLGELAREDAVELVERLLNSVGVRAEGTLDASLDDIESLVETVNRHARTLTLLGPTLRHIGVMRTTREMAQSMAQLASDVSNQTEKSLSATVELCLRRLSPVATSRVAALALCHGGVHLGVLRVLVDAIESETLSLANELVETGLATLTLDDYLRLNPALGPYLRSRIVTTALDDLTRRWIGAMLLYVDSLEQLRNREADRAAALTSIDLPNLFALLELVKSSDDTSTAIELSAVLFRLLQSLGKPRLLDYLQSVRDAASSSRSVEWDHSVYQIEDNRIDHYLMRGRLSEAYTGAERLFARAKEAGEHAYPEAAFDLAMAHFTIGRVLKAIGNSESAVPAIEVASVRFESLGASGSEEAARMSDKCLTELGECLLNLRDYRRAERCYRERLRRTEIRPDDRAVAICLAQLGRLFFEMGKLQLALDHYRRAKLRHSEDLDPTGAATCWHQIGIILRAQAEREESIETRSKLANEAETAFRKSLAIEVRIGNKSGQATSLAELGKLYDGVRGKSSTAADFFRQAAELFESTSDFVAEARQRASLAICLRKTGDIELARSQVRIALNLGQGAGLAFEPWNAWTILAEIETSAGDQVAADQARAKASESYLSYRRGGGGNFNVQGRISDEFSVLLATGDTNGAADLLRSVEQSPVSDLAAAFTRVLRRILNGERELSLAAFTDLDWIVQAEVLLILEQLSARPPV